MNGLAAHHPAAALRRLWGYRFLVEQLVRKELRAKYRKSALGLAWLVLSPVLLVSAYTLVFGVLLQVRWGGAGTTLEFALVLHAGVMFYMFFYEVMVRSTTLLANHQSFVTKMVFPLDVFPAVVVIVATINFAVTLLVWILLSIVIRGEFPWGIAWMPLIFVPFTLFCAGLCWFFSALSVYKADLEHAMPMVLLMMMYLSPLLFPVERMPDAFRWVIALNPLTWVLEAARAALMHGSPPSLAVVGVGLALSIGVFWVGYRSFRGNQRGFADVL